MCFGARACAGEKKQTTKCRYLDLFKTFWKKKAFRGKVGRWEPSLTQLHLHPSEHKGLQQVGLVQVGAKILISDFSSAPGQGRGMAADFWRGMEKTLRCQRRARFLKCTRRPAQTCHPSRAAASGQSSLRKDVLPMGLTPSRSALICIHIYIYISWDKSLASSPPPPLPSCSFVYTKIRVDS